MQKNVRETQVLSFSLRFCSGSEKHCKSPAKLIKCRLKPVTLHTCSRNTRFFTRAKKKAPHCSHRLINIDLAELFGNYSVHIFCPLFFIDPMLNIRIRVWSFFFKKVDTFFNITFQRPRCTQKPPPKSPFEKK